MSAACVRTYLSQNLEGSPLYRNVCLGRGRKTRLLWFFVQRLPRCLGGLCVPRSRSVPRLPGGWHSSPTFKHAEQLCFADGLWHLRRLRTHRSQLRKLFVFRTPPKEPCRRNTGSAVNVVREPLACRVLGSLAWTWRRRLGRGYSRGEVSQNPSATRAFPPHPFPPPYS